MTGGDELTDEELAARAARNRAQRADELDALEADLRRRKQSTPPPMRDVMVPNLDAVEHLERVAGLRVPDGIDVTPRQDTGCPACDRPADHDPDDPALPWYMVGQMCDDHQRAAIRAAAERLLRPVLVEHVALTAHARPEDLLPILRDWNPDLGGVYLYGAVGRGKTHNAVALVKVAWGYIRRVHDRPATVEWRNVPRMMDDIASTFGVKGASYPMGPLYSADILVLDDIGIGDNFPFAVRKLYGLIEARMQARRCTIITSNKDLDELGQHLESPQIASRLSQYCAQVPFDGLPDRRPTLAPRLSPPTDGGASE